MTPIPTLTPAQHAALREEARCFAREHLRPAAAVADRTGEIPPRVLEHPWADILSAAYVPCRYGGGVPIPGSDRRIECSSQISILLTEELAWGDPGLTCGLPGPSLTFPVLCAFGSEAQRERYFRKFSTQRNVWGAFAITESHAGSDATALRTRARKVDGGYILNGTKCFITNGARADYTIVFATIDASRKQFGLRAFIVDRDAPGFSIGTVEKMMGLGAAGIAEIVLDECFVPKSQLLCGPDRKAYLAGFHGATAAWSFFRIEVSAISVGIARAIADTLRSEYGKTLPEVERDIHIGRMLCQRAAHAHDTGLPAQYAVSIAKAYTAQFAMRMAVRGIEIIGAEALVEGHLFERLYRAAKVFDILEGTGEMQREHICTHLRI
ncbi:MAG: acyl-CoA dehydrogenase family protein [Deltaproteobacteria bacterium]|nr:acyl-CoA dehydrogenase family protein [Deltaproteobacteria bacterium]